MHSVSISFQNKIFFSKANDSKLFPVQLSLTMKDASRGASDVFHPAIPFTYFVRFNSEINSLHRTMYDLFVTKWFMALNTTSLCMVWKYPNVVESWEVRVYNQAHSHIFCMGFVFLFSPKNGGSRMSHNGVGV